MNGFSPAQGNVCVGVFGGREEEDGAKKKNRRHNWLKQNRSALRIVRTERKAAEVRVCAKGRGGRARARRPRVGDARGQRVPV